MSEGFLTDFGLDDDMEPTTEMRMQLEAMEARDDARVAAFPETLRKTVIQSVRRTDRMAILLWLAHSDAQREAAQLRDRIDALQAENERLRDASAFWLARAAEHANERNHAQARVTLLEGLLHRASESVVTDATLDGDAETWQLATEIDAALSRSDAERSSDA